MKRILLITSIIFCSKFIIAQESNNYRIFIAFLDSLKKEYSVKRFINGSMVDLSSHYKDRYPELSENEQNKVVDYLLSLYNQTEYLGLYGLAGVLLDRYYDYSKDNIKTRMIEIHFDKIAYMSSEVINFGQSQHYSLHAKNRLLEIVEKRWNEEDIKAWTIFIKQTLNMNSYKKDVQKIMKETNRNGEKIEDYLLDSLVRQGVEKNLQRNMNRPVYKRCILMIGSLNDLRFVPGLESMLEEYKDHKEYPEIKKACTYALAKLGVQKYLDEIYASDDINYSYLGTKEAYLRWLEINFDWTKSDRVYSAGALLPNPLVIIPQTPHYIKNIPRELWLSYMDAEKYAVALDKMSKEQRKNYDPLKDEENKEFIQKIYKLYHWIKDNPDKWEMPPASDRF
jgi:hypothetical protein